jgi:hypothetical protein
VTFESGSRLERIEEYAFYQSGLKSILIPTNVAFVCGSAFVTISISISRDSQHFRIRESFLEHIHGSTIYRYFGPFRSIVIPSSVVVLGKWSFYECKSLESVTFENGSRLERIEESAFGLSGLRSIEIPSSVAVLGKSSFCACKSFESVRFESGSRLERIEESAFGLSGLRSIEIPSSVVVLGDSSFSECRSLESVTFEIGSRLDRIDRSMFAYSGVNFELVSEELRRTKGQTRYEN